MSSSLLDETVAQRSNTAADRLRTTMAAVRVSMSWFGTRKTLTAEQKKEAAEPFGTDARFLSAGKRLLDISHPAYKAVTAVRGKVIAYWKSMAQRDRPLAGDRPARRLPGCQRPSQYLDILRCHTRSLADTFLHEEMEKDIVAALSELLPDRWIAAHPEHRLEINRPTGTPVGLEAALSTAGG